MNFIIKDIGWIEKNKCLSIVGIGPLSQNNIIFLGLRGSIKVLKRYELRWRCVIVVMIPDKLYWLCKQRWI